MTYDEAMTVLAKFNEKYQMRHTSSTNNFQLEVFEALGMLKLDASCLPIFVHNHTEPANKLCIDIGDSFLRITPIVNNIGDTLNLNYDDV
jgi:hypothetical protein